MSTIFEHEDHDGDSIEVRENRGVPDVVIVEAGGQGVLVPARDLRDALSEHLGDTEPKKQGAAERLLQAGDRDREVYRITDAKGDRVLRARALGDAVVFDAVDLDTDEAVYVGLPMFTMGDARGLARAILAHFGEDRATEAAQDQRVQAWLRVAEHRALAPCFDSPGTLIDAVIARLDALADVEAALEERVDRVRAAAFRDGDRAGYGEGYREALADARQGIEPAAHARGYAEGVADTERAAVLALKIIAAQAAEQEKSA